jgi:dihydrolipoamide dehydrogenase
MAEAKRQLVVVGGGPGGYAAAFLAADLGLEVTLVDPEPNPGGVCLYRGCIPSKALLHAASVLREIQRGAEWGLAAGKVRTDVGKLRSWSKGVVETLTGGLGQLAKMRKIEHLRGRGRFRDTTSLEVQEEGGGRRTLPFEKAIVATGARPVALPGVPFESPLVMDSTAALELEEVPGTLLVVGGGYIGLELGSVYAALGSRVTVVEMLPEIMSGTDRDLVKVYAREAEGVFESIRLRTTARLKVGEDGVEAALEPQEGQAETKRFARVLVAVGRRPNTQDIGLENTGVELDEKGFIEVDERRRTAELSIYAIGDVTGGPMLAHKATHEGRVAVEAIAGRPAAFDPRAIPAVVFTDPEIAVCGLTEAQAQAQGRRVEVARFPWSASGRSLTLGRKSGLTKLVIDPESHRILGAGIVGASAGELIGEATLAVEMAARVEDLALTIHTHPTLTETLMEAAEAFEGTATSIYRPKRRKEQS